MGSLIDQTEGALARVLSLCSNGGVGQEDVDALQRHDEATLSLLEVNDDDAIKVCGCPIHRFGYVYVWVHELPVSRGAV